MKSRRNKLLVEPPGSATGDIAFNLIVFFLLCASVQPDSGVPQSIPSSETVAEQQLSTENIEVQLTKNAVAVNGDIVAVNELVGRLKTLLVGKKLPEQRVVVVKSRKDVPYRHWIAVTSRIQQAGGIITLQLEEEQRITIPGS